MRRPDPVQEVVEEELDFVDRVSGEFRLLHIFEDSRDVFRRPVSGICIPASCRARLGTAAGWLFALATAPTLLCTR